MKIMQSITKFEDRRVSSNTSLDSLYLYLKTYPEAVMPLTHIFTAKLYTRQIFMPKDTCVISRIHKYEHPFLVSQGDVSVWHSDGSVIRIKAPFLGVTQPGTQRALYNHSDTLWTTFHVTDLLDPDEIVSQITVDPDELSITIGEDAMKLLREGAT